jgi:hypothetical protein
MMMLAEKGLLMMTRRLFVHGTTYGAALLVTLGGATMARAQPLAPPAVRFPLSTEPRVINTFP